MKFVVSYFLLFFCQTLARENIAQSLGFSDDVAITQDMAANLPRCETGTWVPAKDGAFPLGSLTVGVDDNNIIFLARSKIMDNIIPGKFVRGSAYVAYGNMENIRNEYEIFCGGRGRYIWVKTNGDIPENAIIAGETEDSQPLYVCRVKVNPQCSASGSVQNGICYIPFEGDVTTYMDYEILTAQIQHYVPKDDEDYE